MFFVAGFSTNLDVVGLFVEDGLLGWNGFPGYMGKVVRCVGGFFIKMGFRKWKEFGVCNVRKKSAERIA